MTDTVVRLLAQPWIHSLSFVARFIQVDMSYMSISDLEIHGCESM